MANPPQRVVIVGGGFGGVAVAQELGRLLPRATADVHLVSRENFFLFHPMLPEVAGGSIETRHILAPLRQLCPKATVTVGVAEEIDLEGKTVTVGHGPHETRTVIPCDFLVLAPGAITNFSEVTGMAQHALGLKTVGDALYLRNHVIHMLEEADSEPDPDRRRELLTFVVAGGGFSGVETLAELNDFVHDVARYYHRVDPREIRMVLLHGMPRILPELSEDLAATAHRHLERRGIEIRLDTFLDGATECEAVLRGGECLPTRTLVCTIGTATNPLIGALPCAKDERGRLVVNEYLEVEDWPGVWGLGDCAAVPNAATGKLAPPTAQFAQREGKLVAHNIAAALGRGEKKRFDFPGLGQFVSIGHRAAVAEVMRFHVSGFIGWFLWRTVYLGKLPSFARKTRVALDWALDLLFGRDVVQLPLARTDRVGRAHYQPGDVIFRQGDVGDLFYVITRGEVEVIRGHEDGSETVLAHLGEGEYFGETSLLRNGRRSATIRALVPLNVLTMGRGDFTVLANSWANLRQSLEAVMQAREPPGEPLPLGEAGEVRN